MRKVREYESPRTVRTQVQLEKGFVSTQLLLRHFA